jgi:hypothetical protein
MISLALSMIITYYEKSPAKQQLIHINDNYIIKMTIYMLINFIFTLYLSNIVMKSDIFFFIFYICNVCETILYYFTILEKIKLYGKKIPESFLIHNTFINRLPGCILKSHRTIMLSVAQLLFNDLLRKGYYICGISIFISFIIIYFIFHRIHYIDRYFKEYESPIFNKYMLNRIKYSVYEIVPTTIPLSTCDLDCKICICDTVHNENFNETEWILLACSHKFHKYCLDQYVKFNDKCPGCYDNKIKYAEKIGCTICIDTYDAGADFSIVSVVEPCKHKFHNKCIYDWLYVSSNRDCPNCRSYINKIIAI